MSDNKENHSSEVFNVLVSEATKIIRNSKFRPKCGIGKPGGLLEIPPELKPVIVGDLHTNFENLKSIIKHDDNIEKLKAGELALILLGDIIHDDQTGQMKDMKSSLEAFEYVLGLIVAYPDRVFYIRGNHDTFDDRLAKSGILQGVECRDYFEKIRGEKFVSLVEKLFSILPQFGIGDGYVVTHGGPPRGGTSRKQLIHLRDFPDLSHQLMWNRISEFRGGTPTLKEYGPEDIVSTLEKLGLPAETPFIVGHNPLWYTGDTSGVWSNVMGVKNHHIIVSSTGTRAPYFTMEDGNMVVKYAL
jgi:hypothetical protein